MNPHKCDMCGLYLDFDGAACELCMSDERADKMVRNYDYIGGYEDERDCIAGEPGTRDY